MYHVDGNELCALIDGVLDEFTDRRLRRHVSRCLICRQRLSDLRSAKEYVSGWHNVQAPRDFEKRVLYRVVGDEYHRSSTKIDRFLDKVAVGMSRLLPSPDHQHRVYRWVASMMLVVGVIGMALGFGSLVRPGGAQVVDAPWAPQGREPTDASVGTLVDFIVEEHVRYEALRSSSINGWLEDGLRSVSRRDVTR